MCSRHPFAARLWADESGISSVEYALLLAFIGGGVIIAADTLSDAVSDQMNGTANSFPDCGNDGDGDGTGGAGGTGQGGGNTC